MKLIKFFAVILFFTMNAAHADYTSPECEQRSGPAKEACYKKVVKSLIDDAESAHFRMGFLYSSKLSPKEMEQFKTKFRGDVNAAYSGCGVDIKCTFNHWAVIWNNYKEINNEISKRQNLNQPLPLLQAQLNRGVVKKTQGIPVTYYEEVVQKPVPAVNNGYQLSETERKLGYTLDDIPEANSEEFVGD